MATWRDYVLTGGMKKAAPSLSNEFKMLRWALSAPVEGTKHCDAPNWGMNSISSDVVIPEGFEAFFAPPVERISINAPKGDWVEDSQFLQVYKNPDTGKVIEIELTMVSFAKAETQNVNIFLTGFIYLTILAVNVITLGLVWGNMGGWVVTDIRESSGRSSGGTSGFGNIRDKFEGLEERVADKKREQARNSRKLMTWLGYGLLGYGIARKNTKVAIGGGLVLAYTRSQKMKALETELNDKIDSLVPSIFQ
jgi:hypothetical protein